MGSWVHPTLGIAWVAVLPLLLSAWMIRSSRTDALGLLSRMAFTAYWILLTVLLVVQNPIAVFHLQRFLAHVPEHGVHFAFFATLALLAWSCRFRVHPAMLFAILLAYGLIVESLQYFVPPRAVELQDYLENLAGVTAGTALWWGAVATRNFLRSKAPAAGG